MKLPLQPLCCLGEGVCPSRSNTPGLRGQRMSTSHHSGVSPSFSPFQRRLVREALWCNCHHLRSTKPIPTQPGATIQDASGPTEPSSFFFQAACISPSSRVQLEMTGSEAQQSPSLQGPTPNSVFPHLRVTCLCIAKRSPSPQETSPLTDLPIPEMPAFEHICPHL